MTVLGKPLFPKTCWPTPEPNVHGTNIQSSKGTADISDEGEDRFYESATILQPQP